MVQKSVQALREKTRQTSTKKRVNEASLYQKNRFHKITAKHVSFLIGRWTAFPLRRKKKKLGLLYRTDTHTVWHHLNGFSFSGCTDSRDCDSHSGHCSHFRQKKNCKSAWFRALLRSFTSSHMNANGLSGTTRVSGFPLCSICERSVAI